MGTGPTRGGQLKSLPKRKLNRRFAYTNSPSLKWCRLPQLKVAVAHFVGLLSIQVLSLDFYIGFPLRRR